MANESASLTEEQSSAVAHLQEIVGCTTDEALLHLVQANWNLEVAVNHCFQPNSAPPSAPSVPPVVNDAIDALVEEAFPPLRSRPGHGSSVAAGPSSSSPSSSASSSSQTARPIGQGARQVIAMQTNTGIWAYLNPVAELVLLPFRYAFSLVSTLVRILSSFWSRPAIRAGPQRVTDAAGDVEGFVTEMQQRYGSNGRELPRFYRGTYAAALREARQDLLFLLVYIHADDNPNADAFCQRVLSDSRFTNFITTNRVLLWGCNTGRPEGQRVAQTVRAITFPVLALISFKQSSMTIVLRISGARMADAAEEVVASLSRAVTMESVHINQERERRRQQAAQQELLREQDRLYAESVRHDTERQRARAEREAAEAAAVKAAEEQRRTKEERRKSVFDQVTARAASLPTEPSSDNSEAIQLVVRLPSSGSQLRRRFLLSDPISSVYEWVHAGYWSTLGTSDDSLLHVLLLVVSYPKRELPVPSLLASLLSDQSAAPIETKADEAVYTAASSLKEIGISKSQALLAVIIEEEESSTPSKSD